MAEVVQEVLQERIENLSARIEEFKKDTKQSLADILNEVRGFNGRLTALELKTSLSDSNFTEFKLSTNSGLEVVNKENAQMIQDIKTLKDNQLLRRGKENGVNWVWRILIGVFTLSYFLMTLFTFVKAFQK